MNLKNKVSIITGAARGIGREIAQKIAQYEGIPVLMDLDESVLNTALEEIKEICPKASAYVLNVTDLDRVKEVFADVANNYGHLDVLVNCAGILHTSSVEDTTKAEWDKVIEINMTAPFFLAQQAYVYMKKQNSGRIINISSLAGRMGGYGTGCAYSTAKAGLIGMTYNLARKMAPSKVTVNAVAPGTTESDIIKGFTPEVLATLIERIPMGRFGKTEDTANAVAFLASEEAGFITGAVLDVNGGMFMG